MNNTQNTKRRCLHNEGMKKIISTVLFIAGLTSQNSANEILVFSPMPEKTVFNTDVLIAASFYALGGVPTDRIQLFMDDIEITDQAEIESEMVSYAPAVLNPGKHTIKVRIFRDNMDPLEKTWSFTVAGEKSWADEVEWEGKFTSDYRTEQIGTENLSIGTLGMYFNGTAYDWFKFKSNVKFASDENPLLQPRNRYTLKLSIGEYFDFGFGDINPRMTRFTLDGKRVRGFHGNLKLNAMNLQFVAGELMRSVDGNLHENESNSAYVIHHTGIQDSLAVFRLSRQGYTFKQNILASRLSFGWKQYFQWGLNFVKVKDDIKSVDPVIHNANILVQDEEWLIPSGIYSFDELLALSGTPTGEGHFYNISLDEKSDWEGAAPKDNLVIGTDVRMIFDNRRILIEGEAAISLFNKDIWDGAISIAQMDTLLDDSLDNSLAGSLDLEKLPFDPIEVEDIFTIGFNMVPLSPIDPSVFNDSLKTNLMEAILQMPSLSYRAGTKLNYFGQYITAEYLRIGPEYRSLANPYLLSGFNQITISDRIRLFKNRMLLTLEYRHQNDDVLTSVSNVTSENRLLTGITLIPGSGMPTFTFGFRNTDRNNGIDEIDTFENPVTDSITYKDNRGHTRTVSFTASVTYVFSAVNASHTVFGTIVSYNKSDQIDTRRNLDPAFVDPQTESGVFNLAWNSRYNLIPLKTNLSLTMNTSQFSTGPEETADQKFLSGRLGAEYGFFEKKITALGGIDFMAGEGVQKISKFGLNGGVRFKLIKGLQAQATLNIRQKSTAGETSSEFIGVAALSYLF